MLPPGTRTLSQLHAERDPIQKVVGAATLLEYVLRSLDPSLTDEDGSALSLGGLIRAHGVRFSDSGGPLFGNRIRNDLIHAGRQREEPLSQKEIADAGRRLLVAVEEALVHAPAAVQEDVGAGAPATGTGFRRSWLLPWALGTVLGFLAIWGLWWALRWAVGELAGEEALDRPGLVPTVGRLLVVLAATAVCSGLWLAWQRVGKLHAGGRGPRWLRPVVFTVAVLLLVLGTYVGLEGFAPQGWLPLLGLGLAAGARGATLKRV